MFGLQPTHLILIIIVALIIFGPQRLPELGRALGRSIREFQDASKEMTSSFNEAVSEKPTVSEKPKTTSENGVPAEQHEVKS